MHVTQLRSVAACCAVAGAVGAKGTAAGGDKERGRTNRPVQSEWERETQGETLQMCGYSLNLRWRWRNFPGEVWDFHLSTTKNRYILQTKPLVVALGPLFGGYTNVHTRTTVSDFKVCPFLIGFFYCVPYLECIYFFYCVCIVSVS